ncbi:aminotransferase class I/II-fold pyridoxal phosphate-dependent enzyme, partial [bacterium]|nr:aminotransferase class I/II-fold pyridoxal phosphate-dependent enzyme [bacterium]
MMSTVSLKKIKQTQSTEKPRVNSIVQAMPPSGIRKFFDLVMARSGVISLGVGEPDFVTPWHICDAGIHSIESGRTSYSPNNGLAALREEIAVYLKNKHNADYAPTNQILVTAGGSEAIDVAFRAIVEPGDEVIVVDPSFVAYAPLAVFAGGVAVRIPTTADNGFVPEIEQLQEACTPKTKAIIVNYPNNPTGAGLIPERMHEIAQFVLEN